MRPIDISRARFWHRRKGSVVITCHYIIMYVRVRRLQRRAPGDTGESARDTVRGDMRATPPRDGRLLLDREDNRYMYSRVGIR